MSFCCTVLCPDKAHSTPATSEFRHPSGFRNFLMGASTEDSVLLITKLWLWLHFKTEKWAVFLKSTDAVSCLSHYPFPGSSPEMFIWSSVVSEKRRCKTASCWCLLHLLLVMCSPAYSNTSLITCKDRCFSFSILTADGILKKGAEVVHGDSLFIN